MSGFLQSLILNFRILVPAFFASGFAFALLDFVMRGGARATFAGGAPEAARMAWWALGLMSATALVVAVPCVLMIAIIERVTRRWHDEGAFYVWAEDLIIGGREHSWATVVGFVLVLAGLWTGVEEFASYLGLSNVVLYFTLIGGKIGACGLTWLLHRMLVRFTRLRPGVPVALYVVTAVAAYLVVFREGAFSAPHRLHLALPVLLILGAVAIGNATKRVPRLQRVRAVVVMIGLSLVATSIVFYDGRTVTHSQLMHRPLLLYPARTLINAIADMDGDGHAAIFGGMDCDDLDASVKPLGLEVVGDGVDNNCYGGDPDQVPERETLIQSEWTAPEKPPIIVVSIDTLRRDYVEPESTPFLSAFEEGGVTFTRAYSASTHTDESIPAAMSGNYPHRWHQDGTYFGLEPTLPEILGQHGYETVGVLAFPWLIPAVIHGMETVDNSMGNLAESQPTRFLANETTELAFKYLDERDPENPLFLWVHFYDPHAPPSFDEGEEIYKELEPGYHLDVIRTDQAIGDFFRGLMDRGIFERAVVVVFSDHGEGLGQHGIATHSWAAYDSVVHVPLIMRVPGIPPAVVDDPVSTASIFGTLIEVLGIQSVTPRDEPSLVPNMVDGVHSGDPVFIEANHHGDPLLRAVVDGHWKLIFDSRRETWQLFNTRADPAETVNLIGAEPERFEKMQATLWDWWDAGYNDRLIERKMSLWEKRGGIWRPRQFIGEELLELREETR